MKAAAGSSTIRLIRRGTDHGRVAEPARDAGPARSAERIACLREKWRRAEPILLPGILEPAIRGGRRTLETSLRLVERLQEGVDLSRILAGPPYPERLGRSFKLTGGGRNPSDPLEIEKVHAAAIARDGIAAPDLYVKANWLSDRRDDASLRLRVSFGLEVLDDWKEDRVKSRLAAEFAARLFPESAWIARNRPLLRLLARLAGGPVEFTQRIYYANATGGGALFHHDVVPRQRGVVYGQLAGTTGWLACPKRFLADQVLLHVRKRRDREALLEELDEGPSDALDRILNRSPAFTRRLVEAGAFRVLRPGDAILLPSHGWNRTCWHSVFCWDPGPNWALSFAIRKVGA